MMKNRVIPFISSLALAALTTTPAAFAQEEAEMPPEDTDEFTPAVEFHGFVDGSVYTTFNVGDNAPDNDPVSFGLDHVELDVTATPTEHLEIQVDLQWFPGIDAIGVLEQGYFTYTPSADGEGGFVRFGRFNAPVGAEAVDAPDRFQYSNGPLYNQAAPTNLFGLAGGYTSDSLTAQAMITGDWDQYTESGDVSFGARVDYGFGDGNIGAVALFNDAASADETGELTFDVNFDYAVDIVTIVAEAHFGYLTGDLPGDPDNVSYGFMGKANIAIADPFSLTARVSYLSRYANNPAVPRGAAFEGIEATIAGLLTFSENYYGVVEVRMDKNIGELDDGITRITPAFELLATF